MFCGSAVCKQNKRLFSGEAKAFLPPFQKCEFSHGNFSSLIKSDHFLLHFRLRRTEKSTFFILLRLRRAKKILFVITHPASAGRKNTISHVGAGSTRPLLRNPHNHPGGIPPAGFVQPARRRIAVSLQKYEGFLNFLGKNSTETVFAEQNVIQ